MKRFRSSAVLRVQIISDRDQPHISPFHDLQNQNSRFVRCENTIGASLPASPQRTSFCDSKCGAAGNALPQRNLGAIVQSAAR
jgi:hypothetical protein